MSLNKFSDFYDSTYDDYYLNQAYNQIGSGPPEIHTYFRGKVMFKNYILKFNS